MEESRDVDASIAFSRDVGFSAGELSPYIEELSDGFGIQFGHKIISPGGCFAVSIAEANLSWRFNVDNIGLLVPGVLIVDERGEVIVDEEWAVLIERTEQ